MKMPQESGNQPSNSDTDWGLRLSLALDVGQDLHILREAGRTAAEVLTDRRIRVPGMFGHPCQVEMGRAVDPLGIGEGPLAFIDLLCIAA